MSPTKMGRPDRNGDLVIHSYKWKVMETASDCTVVKTASRSIAVGKVAVLVLFFFVCEVFLFSWKELHCNRDLICSCHLKPGGHHVGKWQRSDSTDSI